MCGTCGCSDPDNTVTITDPESGERRTLDREPMLVPLGHRHQLHGHDHDHDHDHGTPHHHGPSGEIVSIEQAVLAENDRIAARNRSWFQDRSVLAVNLVSSPGAGKTTLLERTIAELAGRIEIAVIEGDQMTVNDADRIRSAGARAIQINTGTGCHLEADMVAEAVVGLDLRPGSVLIIENVGNLVCPALFDLGEHMKVVVASTTEGEDKPLKYPHMFRAADVVIVNKIDLAPHVEFDQARFVANLRSVNPEARLFALSARTGAGLAAWLGLLQRERRSRFRRASDRGKFALGDEVRT